MRDRLDATLRAAWTASEQLPVLETWAASASVAARKIWNIAEQRQTLPA
jgi:hypothetical protein